MNKAELIDYIAHEEDLPKATVGRVLDSLADAASTALDHGEELTLPGLGKLKTTIRAARTGRNPATGAAIEIPAKRAVTFTAAKALKDAVA